MSLSNAGSFASAVSRALRKQGLRPLPSGTPLDHQGVRVERHALDGYAHVSVDYLVERRAQRVAADVEQALTDAGYTVDRAPGSVSMTVHRAAPQTGSKS